MLKSLLPCCYSILIAISLNPATNGSTITVSAAFEANAVVASETSNALAYTVTEIALPESANSFVEQYGQSADGSIFITFGRRSAIKPVGENWILAPEGFIASYMTQTGYVAGKDFNSDQAAFWEAITSPLNSDLILASGFRYNVRGLSENGSVLLKPSNAGADQSLIYRNGQLTPLDGLGYSFDLDGLFPVRLLPSGTIRGVYLKDTETIHPFAIIDDQLSIDETISLSVTQADEIDAISENGHVITRINIESADLFGPEINSIQNIEQFTASSINDRGFAVGKVPLLSPNTALLWSPALGLRELNSFVPSESPPLLDARAIQNDLSLLAISIDAENRYHLYRLTEDTSFSAASIDVTTTLGDELLIVSVMTNFDAQEVTLQQRSENGNWSDTNTAPTQMEGNSYLFEVPIPSAGLLLRVIATRAGSSVPAL